MIASEKTDFYSPRCYPHFKEMSALGLRESCLAWPSPWGKNCIPSESLFHTAGWHRREIAGQESGHLIGNMKSIASWLSGLGQVIWLFRISISSFVAFQGLMQFSQRLRAVGTGLNFLSQRYKHREIQ